MNRNQIIELLQIAATHDGRKPSESAIYAWTDAAYRARWQFAAAAEAIKDHYANSAEFIRPGHITERIRTTRSAAADRYRPEPMPDNVPTGKRLRELIDDAWRAIGVDPETRRGNEEVS